MHFNRLYRLHDFPAGMIVFHLLQGRLLRFLWKRMKNTPENGKTVYLKRNFSKIKKIVNWCLQKPQQKEKKNKKFKSVHRNIHIQTTQDEKYNNKNYKCHLNGISVIFLHYSNPTNYCT